MSFSLQRINPRLTGNIKLVVTEGESFLESIDSDMNLSRGIYKGHKYNEDKQYGQNVRQFVKQFTDIDDIYTVAKESDITISNNLSDQYHTIYDYGCYSNESKVVDSSFRFFAPLHVKESDYKSGTLPDRFVIYRLAAENTPRGEELFSLSDASHSTYADSVMSGELVASFELKQRYDTLFRGIRDSHIEFDYKEDANVTGLDILTGFYVTKTDRIDLNSLMANERTITELENNITNLYTNNNVVFSNIVNFEFAFDDNVDDSAFVRYVGYYITENEVDKATIDSTFEQEFGAYNLKLLNTENGIRKYALDDTTAPLGEYFVDSFSMFANSFGSVQPPLIRMRVAFNPSIGEQIILQYQGIDDIIVTFSEEIIGRTPADTQTNLVQAIIDESRNASLLSVTAYEEEGDLVIQSTIPSRDFENIRAYVPSNVKIVKPALHTGTYENTFYGSFSDTVLSNEYRVGEPYDRLRYTDDNGLEVTKAIVRITKIRGQYAYKLDSDFTNKSITNAYVFLVEKLIEQPIIASVLQHKAIDVDNSKSEHADVLDFDLELFHAHLVSIVNEDSFLGRLPETSTPTEIANYKIDVLAILDSYFGTIEVNKEFLIKDIEIVTKEASTVSNEYDRLAENEIEGLAKINKLYKFINKWKLDNSKDVYALDYRLNNSLAFRYDNFSPSTISVDRDIRYHTHSWMILGEGANPYLGAVSEDNVHKHLSYSAVPLTEESLKDTSADAYENLTYETEYRKHYGYSIIQEHPKNGKIFTFFRGLHIEFDDASLVGYKFSVVLLSKEHTENDVLNTLAIRNNTFDTFTVVNRFYIPDPILTSLERGDDFYYLDRSLLYFSNQIFSTALDTINFGEAPVSLSMYNSESVKFFLDIERPNKDWYFVDGAGDKYVYVERGNDTRFKNSFSEVLQTGDDFVVYLTDTFDDNDPNFGVVITYKNIREIRDNYFWCEDIHLKTVVTIETDDPKDMDDNIVDYILEFNVVEELLKPGSGLLAQDLYENLYYISKAIAFENAMYEKIVRAATNVARYTEISTANITKKLNDSAVSVMNSEDESSSSKITVISPDNLSIVVRLAESSGELGLIQNPYVYPIIRYTGIYTPRFELLNSFGDDNVNNIEKSIITKMIPEKREVLKISNTISSKNNGGSDYFVIDEAYERSVSDNEFYLLVRSTSTNVVEQILLPWISTATELRQFTSIIFNSAKSIYADTIYDTEGVSLFDAFGSFANSMLAKQLQNVSEAQKLDILKFLVSATEDTYMNFDFDKIVTTQFMNETLFKLYTVDSAELPDGTKVGFYISNNILFAEDSVTSGQALKIVLSRN